MKLIKIAATGPESTGKSILAEQLASHYQTVWAPEYARIYLEKLSRPYNQNDLLHIAREQVKQEQTLLCKARRFFFADTEMTVIKIWSRVKFGRCDPEIIDLYNNQHYDLYLLMDVDLPWQPDPQREHPHMRKELFDLYLKELKNSRRRFAVVSGEGDQRFQNAVACINRHFLEM